MDVLVNHLISAFQRSYRAKISLLVTLTHLNEGGHGAKGGRELAEVKCGDDQDEPSKHRAMHFSNRASDCGSRHNLLRTIGWACVCGLGVVL